MTEGSLTHAERPSSGGGRPLTAAHGGDHPTAAVWFSSRSTAAPGAIELPPGCRHRAWLRQIHSASVLPARHGASGEGDALWTAEEELALLVMTADCVPVLIATGDVVVAVHAGWRGICGGVVEAGLRRLEPLGDAVTAWIGPAIGPCCYEVGDDVAVRVAAASSAEAVVQPGGHRPRLDLPRAVSEQLLRAGVGDIRLLRRCSRCEPSLASYRRDGRRAGRNYSAIWRPRRPDGARPKARS